MDSYDSNQILILLDFSRSTRFAILCTAQIAKFELKTRHNFGGFEKIGTHDEKTMRGEDRDHDGGERFAARWTISCGESKD
jgi:hypothetical protein